MGRLEGKRAFITGADAYTAAKGGVLTLTKALAMQCAPWKIRVSAIAPGAVLTERTRSMGMKGDDDGTDPARPIRNRPAGRGRLDGGLPGFAGEQLDEWRGDPGGQRRQRFLTLR